MKEIIEFYCRDEQRELKKIAYPLMIKFGGISQKDHDDFYSLAALTLLQAVKSYDREKGIPLKKYLETCINRKFETLMSERNCKKRICDRLSDSLETPVGEDGMVLGDTLVSDFDMEAELLKEEESGNERVETYLSSLSKLQRKIVELKMEGVPVIEIKRKLGLTDRQYKSHMRSIRSYEKTAIFFHDSSFGRIRINEEDKGVTGMTHSMEKSKQKSYSVDSIIKKMKRETIRFDHPTQRNSGQWNPKMKGNLISDILQENPIPALVFAEQIKDDIVTIWDLDGKQRCTNVFDFANDGYRISKNIKRWMMTYQTKTSVNGVTRIEKRAFDIRGKLFSELPEELQERFLDYTFEVTQYLNCSDEDIEYHIGRYNEGKPMNPAQKGLGSLGTRFAGIVKSIANMDFFKDGDGYKPSELNNGTLNRVVIESVMVINYLDQWKKQQEEICVFLRDHASCEDFDNFEDVVERLTKVITEETSEMFNAKDSFLWFCLFDKFTKLGIEDCRFVEFLSEFKHGLSDKPVNGITYEALDEKGTKDKRVIMEKLKLLEVLMKEYLYR